MGKVPLNIDWEMLLPNHNHDPPPELEIISENQKRVCVEELSDHQLDEKIRRMHSDAKKMAPRLRDNGAKYFASIKQLEEERERRKLQRIQKDADESGKPTQSQSSSFSDASLDFKKPQTPQSLFGARFSLHLEEKSGNTTSNAFDEELRAFGQGNCKSKSQDGLAINNGRQGTRMSLRKMPFRSVSCPSGNCKRIAFSSYPPHPPKGNMSDSFSEKMTSPVRTSRDSKKRKVETIVVLDEEDTHPIQPLQQVDEAEGWIKDTKIYYPSRSHPEAVELCGSDLDCLNPRSHLSSPIMNFYIQYLQKSFSPTGRVRGDYHLFNTYFYKKLEEAVSCKRKDKSAYYVKFRRWWKGINIFQKAYIFLPIHADEHWSLAIICIPCKEDELGPMILHLDSLRYHNSDPIFENIESYLREEWEYLKQSVPPADVPIADRVWKNLSRRITREVISVPQQKNDSDCGLFVLYFMERFIEEAPERLRKKDLNMFDSKWFRPEEASGLRRRIKELLCEQYEHARLENGGNKSPSSVVDSDEQCSDS